MVRHEETINYAWIADEYKPHEYDLGWYAGLFFFGAILIIWSLYVNNIIATILFAVMVLTLYILSHHQPGQVRVEISHKGIMLDDVLYSYRSLNYFWILYPPNNSPVLGVETQSIINRHLEIELEDQDPELVREFLDQYLEEIEAYEENFIDFIIKKLKI